MTPGSVSPDPAGRIVVCPSCGNDEVAEDLPLCLDCLEAGENPDDYPVAVEPNAEIDARLDALVAAFWERYPRISDREDIGESDLRETLRLGLTRVTPPDVTDA